MGNPFWVVVETFGVPAIVVRWLAVALKSFHDVIVSPGVVGDNPLSARYHDVTVEPTMENTSKCPAGGDATFTTRV